MIKRTNLMLLLSLMAVFMLNPATSYAQTDVACAEDVIVQADDWLSKLADKFFGDIFAYPAIVEATNARAAEDDSYATIENPDLIEIGWKLCIPGTADGQALSDDAATAPAEPEAGLPDLVVAQRPAFRPEGIEYDQTNGRFLLGSLAEGTVFEIADDGTVTPFIEDEELVSSVGIEVDEAGNRLLVPNSDAAVFGGAPGQAKLGIYDLSTGERLEMIDLAAVGPEEAAGHFANDIAVDEAGNIYVTDSPARVIYKVDTSGTASVFIASDRFADIENHFLNGIVYHLNGYLLVAETRNGVIYKIPVNDPNALSEVQLPEPMLGADGMLLHPNGNLIVVSNSENRVVALGSDDDFASADIEGVASLSLMAPTAAIRGDEVYVIHAHFGEDPQPDAYEIERITFE